MTIARHMSRFRRAYRDLCTLGERETWPRAHIEGYQLERLNQMWSHALRHVPWYRERYAGGRAPERFDTLETFRRHVPILSNDEVRANPEAFLSERRAPGRWRRTGGSTSAPMSQYWGHEAYREMLRGGYRFLQSWGIDIFDRNASVWGHGASPITGPGGLADRIRRPIEDRMRNRIRLPAHDLSPANLRECLHRISDFRPVVVQGHSNALHLLALEADRLGYRCDSVRLFVATGPAAFPHQAETITRTFGVPAAVEHDAVECGFIARESPDRIVRVREDMGCLESVPRDDGRNEIVSTVLVNPSFPLFRHAVGRLVDEPFEPPAYGFAGMPRTMGAREPGRLAVSGAR